MYCKLIGTSFVVLAGCGATTVAESGAEPAQVGTTGHCPDPSECTQGNGTGVYFAEDGYAGIGPTQFMIMRFINNVGRSGTGARFVTFQGRYLDNLHHQWYVLDLDHPGTIESATYKGNPVRVVSVEEQLANPAWTVIYNGETHSLTGGHLVGLQLSIVFEVSQPASAAYHYLLEFYEHGVVHGERFNHTVQTYGLRWRDSSAAPDNTTPYCFAPDATDTLQPDPVVFQQGMSVNPVTGLVTRGTTGTKGLVTVSCSGGALATVYLWGYEYRGEATDYFDAGIQMKRASYCGDGRTFTKAGTPIQFTDDHHTIDQGTMESVEAWWTPKRALCFNPDHARHPELVENFDHTCTDPVTHATVTLPICPLMNTPPPWPPTPSTTTPTPPPSAYIMQGRLQPGP